jgi:hypothetical protein
MSHTYINLPPASGGSTPQTSSNFFSQYPSNVGNYFINEYDVFPNVLANAAAGNLLTYVSGTAAAYQISDKSAPLAGINSTEKAIGVIYLNSGSTSSGNVYCGFGSNNVATISFGSQQVNWGIRHNISHLSDGTDTFTVYNGHMDTVLGAPANGLFFRYTHGTNSGKWQYCSAAGSGIVAADTGVAPVAGVYQVFEIVVNTAGTAATFYIDGVLVGTISTGLPTAGVFPGITMLKSAGSNSRGPYVDALYLATERLASR